jgi:galactokinase
VKPDAATVRAAFSAVYGHSATAVVRSPGRVNLIGEHTDYNEGFVFPAALDLGTTVAVRPRSDRQLNSYAARLGRADNASLDDLLSGEVAGWARYVRGTAALLLQSGVVLPGADLLIDGDLPMGSGLSSSASLELGVAQALLTLAGRTMSVTELAQLGRRVENEVIGLRSGIMDQLAVAGGVAGHALLIDCRSYAITPVAIPADLRVLVLDSAAPRTLAGSAYNQRRSECESALEKLCGLRPGMTALRDVDAALLEQGRPLLTDVEYRRARHVVSENQRVLDCVAALQAGDAERVGALMNASHDSLRSDYEVSGPELDLLVELARAQAGVYGARLTGAGFGGCVVALAQADAAEQAVQAIVTRYSFETGRSGHGYVTTPSAGVMLLTAG